MPEQPEREKTAHDFQPSYSDPTRCGFITEGETWTGSDPHRCRKTREEHGVIAPSAAAPVGASLRERIEREIEAQDAYARGDTPCAEVWKDRPGPAGHAHTAAVLRLLLQAADFEALASSPTPPPTFGLTEKQARYVLRVIKERDRPDHACRFCVSNPMAASNDFVCLRHQLEAWLPKVEAEPGKDRTHADAE